METGKDEPEKTFKLIFMVKELEKQTKMEN